MPAETETLAPHLQRHSSDVTPDTFEVHIAGIAERLSHVRADGAEELLYQIPASAASSHVFRANVVEDVFSYVAVHGSTY